MELSEAKRKFIRAWGDLSVSWGISKTMAQVHALLLSSSQPMSAMDIKEALDISIGSAHNNVHLLLDWNLIYRSEIADQRKDYFTAEKDMWEIFRRIAKKRKEKELEPLLDVLDDLLSTDATCRDSEEFCKMIRELRQMASGADSSLEALIRSDANWFVNTWMHMVG